MRNFTALKKWRKNYLSRLGWRRAVCDICSFNGIVYLILASETSSYIHATIDGGWMNK